MKHLYILITFFAVSNFSLTCLAADKKTKVIEAIVCENALSELTERKGTLEKMGLSLDTLMGKGSDYRVPTQVLFQVDLSKPDEIKKRIKELSLRIFADAEELSAEFKSYDNCNDKEVIAVIESVKSMQANINLKKVDFLKIENDKRDNLISNYQTTRNKIDDKYGLKNQLSNSQQALEEAQAGLQDAEKQSAELNNSVEESILTAKSAVDKTMIDLETEHLAFIKKLKDKDDSLELLRAKLSAVYENNVNLSANKISYNYSEVSGIWEQTVDYLLEVFSDIELQSDVELPSVLILEIESEKYKDNYEEYLVKYKKAENRKMALIEARTKLLDDMKVTNFKLLQDAGTLRAQLLSKCDAVHCDRPRGLNEKNVGILLREIRVVPLRFVAGGLSKWIEIKSKFVSGLDGWLDLVRQIFILFILIMIPFFLTKILRWTSDKLDKIKKDLISKSMLDYRRRTTFAVWIARLNPFVPSVGMIISIGFARSLIQDTDLKELAMFLYYFQVYYIYRTVKLLLTICLEVAFSTDSVDTLKQQKVRIKKSATRISRLVFIEFILLHITEDTVRRALAYQMFSNLIFWVNVAFTFIETAKWKDEISSSFSYRFPNLWNRLQPAFKSKISNFILPILFLLTVSSDVLKFISSHLVRIDLVKRLLSEVLRKRLERAEKESITYGPPPQDYLSSFDYYLSANKDIYIHRDNSTEERAINAISDWVNKKSTDDLLIIVGNRGMGKTTALDHISVSVSKDCVTKSKRVPSKVVTADALFAWLSELLEEKISSIDEFKQFDRNLGKPVVFFVDDIQNLFLGMIGGFEAYKLFLEVITLKTANVYWCLSVNSRSWAYLKGVLGAEHFYGKVMYLAQWKDFEIQKMILARHQQTKFSRTFDDSIKAYGAGDSFGQQAEGQFFRLLWGQSRGNPRSALMYWISAISSPADGQVHVGVPLFIGSSLVASMSDDALFLLSAIARHDSLTQQELKQITNVGDTTIRKCLKEAQDKNLVWLDENDRVRISSRAQYVIDYFLIGKNFLYE